MKKKFTYNIGDRVSLVRSPDQHGTVRTRVAAAIDLYFIQWDENPGQIRVSFANEICGRTSCSQV